MDQAQLEESLQQQQAVTQQMLDVMNEKIENWVCQCFSDLRNRIIELVGISSGLHHNCHSCLVLFASKLSTAPVLLLWCYLW